MQRVNSGKLRTSFDFDNIIKPDELRVSCYCFVWLILQMAGCDFAYREVVAFVGRKQRHIGSTGTTRPRRPVFPEGYINFLSGGISAQCWSCVGRLEELRPGDLISYRYHCMIAAEGPKVVGRRTTIKVAESTSARADTGVGLSTITIKVEDGKMFVGRDAESMNQIWVGRILTSDGESTPEEIFMKIANRQSRSSRRPAVDP